MKRDPVPVLVSVSARGKSRREIRSAALHATLLAVEERCTAVCQLHLETAVRSEYHRTGATCPLDGSSIVARRRGLDAFPEVMRS
jgi:hypothetical protein